MQINVRDVEPRDTRRRWRIALITGIVALTMLLTTPMVVQEIAYAMEKGRHEAAREHLDVMSRKDDISPLFNAVAEAVKPSVVVIHASKKVKVRSGGIPDEFLRDLPFELPPELRRRRGEDRFRVLRGEGSGVIVDAEKGYILTNYHVAGDADKLEIILADGRSFESEWVRGDAKTDLAVIKINADNLIACPLGNSDDLKVGHWVLAIGSPMGLPQTVTAGVVSAKGRGRTSRGPLGDPEGYRSYIQTDAAINRGNSGGPLVNMKGEVVGINTMILSNTGMFQGVGMSIPSNMARNIMDQLVESGKVVRGYLGVHIQNIDEPLAESFRLPNARGALVTQVQADSPAEKGGLKVEDFITAVDGKAVRNVNQLRNVIAAMPPGATTKLTVMRDGEEETVTIELGTLPEDTAVSTIGGEEDNGQAAVERYGFDVRTLTDALREELGYGAEISGAVVEKVAPTSDAAEVGLRPGMVITHVDKKAVQSASDLASAIKGAGDAVGIRLRVATPKGGRLYFFVPAAK
ncbi:MAG: Do family serine endopeptidase [Planctomycetes bacterium]|jgi:serine protease Do|nr:Do family serine endopeptidase [Phycisphaerae bacterium]NBB95798.1 Do family serine endopeptidase [Planctomycetota bacterium]